MCVVLICPFPLQFKLRKYTRIFLVIKRYIFPCYLLTHKSSFYSFFSCRMIHLFSVHSLLICHVKRICTLEVFTCGMVFSHGISMVFPQQGRRIGMFHWWYFLKLYTSLYISFSYHDFSHGYVQRLKE